MYYQYVSSNSGVTPDLNGVPQGNLAACPSFVSAMDLIGKRWNGMIVQALAGGCVGFAEVRRFCPGLTDAVLARRFKELEDGGLVTRAVLPETRPPAVRYGLTDAGHDLAPILDALTAWGERHALPQPVKEHP